jgi:hypothetical protein
MADSKEASLMSIMTMARHGRQLSLPSRYLRMVEGFEERDSRTWASVVDEVLISVCWQESVFSTKNPTYKNLLEWSGRRTFFAPSGTVISLAHATKC